MPAPRSRRPSWRGTRRAAKVAVVAGTGNNGGDGFVAARHLRCGRVPGRGVPDRARGERVRGDAAAALRQWGGPIAAAPELAGAARHHRCAVRRRARPAGDRGGARGDRGDQSRRASGVCGRSSERHQRHHRGRAWAPPSRPPTPSPSFARNPAICFCRDAFFAATVAVAQIGIPTRSWPPSSRRRARTVRAMGRPVPGAGPSRAQIQPRPCGRGVGRRLPIPARRGSPPWRRCAAAPASSPWPRRATRSSSMPRANLAVMVRPVDAAAELECLLADRRFNAVAIGPGAGVGLRTREMALAALAGERAVVLDADALTSFADSSRGPCSRRSATTGNAVLTPHAGEFHRLFDKPLENIPRPPPRSFLATMAAAAPLPAPSWCIRAPTP